MLLAWSDTWQKEGGRNKRRCVSYNHSRVLQKNVLGCGTLTPSSSHASGTRPRFRSQHATRNRVSTQSLHSQTQQSMCVVGHNQVNRERVGLVATVHRHIEYQVLHMRTQRFERCIFWESQHSQESNEGDFQIAGGYVFSGTFLCHTVSSVRWGRAGNQYSICSSFCVPTMCTNRC